MKKLVHKKIGENTHTFEVEGKNFFECQMQAQKLSFDNVDHCGLCQSSNLDLHGKTVNQEYEFISILCRDCRGTLNLSRRRDDPSFYYLPRNKDKTLAWKAPFYDLSNDQPNMLDQNSKGE